LVFMSNNSFRFEISLILFENYDAFILVNLR
jgi:hypothetical protein